MSTSQTIGAETKWYMITDLSDTVTWPHNQTVGLTVDFITWTVLTGSNSNGTMDLGVITQVDDSFGSVQFFYHSDWIGQSGGGAGIEIYENSINFTPGSINCTVLGGSPVNLLSSSGVTNDILINTLSNLTGVATAAPGVGDIVMRLVNDNVSSAAINVTVGYHSL